MQVVQVQTEVQAQVQGQLVFGECHDWLEADSHWSERAVRDVLDALHSIPGFVTVSSKGSS